MASSGGCTSDGSANPMRTFRIGERDGTLFYKGNLWTKIMVSKPKISVIVTIYNNGDVLEKCLKSIRGQTFKDFELIVVDESSKDNGPAIAKKYADKIIKSPNDDFDYNRNLLVQEAKGEWLLFLDCDERLSIENNPRRIWRAWWHQSQTCSEIPWGMAEK